MKADIADIKVFLRQFDIEYLAGRGVLRRKIISCKAPVPSHCLS